MHQRASQKLCVQNIRPIRLLHVPCMNQLFPDLQLANTMAANQPLPERSIAWEEWIRYQNSTASRTLNTQTAAWTFAGPGVTQSGYYGIGRLNTITFHPTDANTFYVGTPAGGLSSAISFIALSWK